MTDRLCPFDKQPCIRERCEVYREELEACAFRFIGGAAKMRPPPKEEKKSSRYKAHLFD